MVKNFVIQIVYILSGAFVWRMVSNYARYTSSQPTIFLIQIYIIRNDRRSFTERGNQIT